MTHLGTAERPSASVPPSFDDLLVRAAGVVLVLALGWLAAVLAAVVVEALSGGRWQPARLTGAPPWLHRALLSAVVGALAVLGTGPAALAEGSSRPSHTGEVARALEGLPLPDRTLGGISLHAEIVVRPGDSLWAIVRRLLPDVGDAAIQSAVEALYACNRTGIGADPGMILPGQRLRLPAGLAQEVAS